MRGETSVTTVGNGAHVGLREKSLIKDRPNLTLTLGVYNAQNVEGMGMGVGEDD